MILLWRIFNVYSLVCIEKRNENGKNMGRIFLYYFDKLKINRLIKLLCCIYTN